MEVVTSIHGRNIPEHFTINYTSSVKNDGSPEEIYNITMSLQRLHYGAHPEIFINDKPYTCGCGRRFEKSSFDKVLNETIKSISEYLKGVG